MARDSCPERPSFSTTFSCLRRRSPLHLLVPRSVLPRFQPRISPFRETTQSAHRILSQTSAFQTTSVSLSIWVRIPCQPLTRFSPTPSSRPLRSLSLTLPVLTLLPLRCS